MELGECSTSIPPQAKRRRGKTFDGVTPYASSTSPEVMKKRRFDVFINHRGCDTKHTLASTIYHTLDLIGIHAFLDEQELELGDSIPLEIEEAIRTAGLHIAIFSERYADSAWCLAELSYMLKTGSPIIPVFYHVDPSDLRWADQGKGCYAHAFSQHEEKGRYSSHMLWDWKMALQRASNLSGHVLKKNIGDEGMLLKSIVNSVLRVIKKEPLEVAKHPVGMNEIVQDFERSLQKYVENEEGVQIVGIVGFGGSGKTTLATELYNRKISSINCSSFLHDVRDAASRKVLHTKQKKLLEDVRIQTKSFDNVKEGKAIIADRLRSLCVLIVLDDVDHEDQLNALLPPKESLGRGSMVIITTRDVDILTKWGVTSIYKVKPLQDLHAKELFCWHAFLQPFPLQGFEDLVESFFNSCKGLPLSLKVIGGQLYSKRSREYWVSQLKKMQRILPNEILERLKVSYDALDEEEKEIFLDIACFFIDERKSMAIDIWEASGWSGQCSWQALQNKCLVESYKIYELLKTGEKHEHIRMHDHLRDLGRQIAKTLSPPRIWCYEGTPFGGITDSGDRRVKLASCGTEAIECTEKWAELLRGVLWLQWYQLKDTSFPSWLPLDTIIVLEIFSPECLETLWEDTRPPLQLREVRIVGAHTLQSLPKSIGCLQHLKRLSLEGASTLSSLPEEFCELQLLEHLVLQGCHALSCLPNRFGDLVNLGHLNLSYCERLKRLPESFNQLIHLKYLDLDGCESLESLDNIANLEAVYFSNYNWIRDHTSVGELSLCFSRRYIGRLLPIICQLSGLKKLQIEPEFLGELPISLENISTLTSYTLKYSSNWKYLPIEISQMSSVQNLIIDGCVSLCEISNLAGLVSLTNLEVKDCYSLQKMEGLEHLTSLENLVLWGWRREPVIQSLRRLERLKTLNLRGEKISDFGDFIQNIEMQNWPPEMTICGEEDSDFKSILDSFTSPGVDVHLIREWTLVCHETNLSNAIVVCYLFTCQDSYCCVRIRKAESTRVELLVPGRWIVISFFKEDSCPVEDGGGGLHGLDIVYDDGEVEVLGGWVMVGERGCIIDGFKQLFQTLSNETPTSSNELDFEQV